MKIKRSAFILLLISALLLTSCKNPSSVPADGKESVAGENSVATFSEAPLVLETIQQMRETIPTADNIAVMLTGYYAAGDGGSGMFYWDAKETAPDNGGTVIAPAGVAVGRYVRLCESNHLNVKWFGAIGDNTTDDTAAIQAAIDALPAEGGEVILPGGSYVIKDTLRIGDGDGTTPSTKNGIRLVGVGGSFGHGTIHSTTLVCRAKIDTMMTINGPISNCRIENINMNVNNHANYGVIMTAVRDSVFQQMKVICQNKTGVILQAGSGEYGDSQNNLFRQFGCTGNATGCVMMEIGGSSDGIVKNITFTDCRFDTADTNNSVAVHILRAEKLTFMRCHFNIYRDTSAGLLLDGRENNEYPRQISYYDCSITRLVIEESENGKIGHQFLLGNGTYDNETYESHPMLFGLTDIGGIIRYDD